MNEGVAQGDDGASASAGGLLEEIVEQLGSDPAQCWQAIEGLTVLDPPAQVAIITELARFSRSPAVEFLLVLLSKAREEATRAAAQSALERLAEVDEGGEKTGSPPPALAAESSAGGESGITRGSGKRAQSLPVAIVGEQRRLLHCLVTPVDGQGRGSIVVSVSRAGQRRTAAFLCDVRHGIRDVFGEVEPETPTAGRLLDDLIALKADECARDAHELALGLLAGSLMLGAGPVAPAIRRLGRRHAGPGVSAGGFPGLDSPSGS